MFKGGVTVSRLGQEEGPFELYGGLHTCFLPILRRAQLVFHKVESGRECGELLPQGAARSSGIDEVKCGEQ